MLLCHPLPPDFPPTSPHVGGGTEADSRGGQERRRKDQLRRVDRRNAGKAACRISAARASCSHQHKIVPLALCLVCCLLFVVDGLQVTLRSPFMNKLLSYSYWTFCSSSLLSFQLLSAFCSFPQIAFSRQWPTYALIAVYCIQFTTFFRLFERPDSNSESMSSIAAYRSYCHTKVAIAIDLHQEESCSFAGGSDLELGTLRPLVQ